MMSGLDWDTLLAIDGQQEEELKQFRAQQGLDPVIEGPAGGRSAGSRDEQPGAGPVSGIGAGRKTGRDEKRAPSARMAAKPGKWDAGTLILDEEEETTDDTDLLFYQLRKKYSGVSHDDMFEQMLRAVPDPVPEWSSESKPAASSPYQKYLSIAQQLSRGQITDSAQKDMILLSGTGEDMDPGMKQFYSVFTLLQGNPSRERIASVMKNAEPGLRGGESARALRILFNAVSYAVRKQDAFDDAQDRHYRTRQGRLNAARRNAQSEYDSAKREADRWRNNNE